MTAWLNVESEPSSTKQMWDFVIHGTSDKLAALLNLPRWNCDTQNPALHTPWSDRSREMSKLD
jgi:hypothetical protein